MQKFSKYIILAILLIVGATIFYKKVYIPKVTYKTVKSIKGDLSVQVFGIGNVGAKDIYKITSQTGGKIVKILTDEGQWVKKGDLLVTIDSIDIPQQLQEAKIAVKKAKSEMIATQKELNSLIAQKYLAEITYKRYEKLNKQSFISKAEYDKAKMDLEVIKSQIEATKAHILSAKLELSKSQKAVDALKEKLLRYKIYSPCYGYVISKDAQIAQSVSPSQNILQIVDSKTVWVKTYIDEKISGNIKVGQKAVIKLRSQPNKEFLGEVKRIVAQSDKVTQEREVDVAFNNVPIPFYINEQAEVTINTKTYTDVVKIPTKALSYYNEKMGVWIKKENRAHFLQIQLIARGNEEIAVSGLNEGVTLLIQSTKNKPLKEGATIIND
ncbi:efflux RND transporter periplasmic adaptor subunit [Hydrogenimonas thermophila]|uniref:RND family efflux transporter, MFP subunit n=1 Tax=Hydrogenimonas thermophila TaxID=223786 RepID=A0A1I5U9I5_9BACT|nr:efflux RND transporter periplasmic adaptor subunit [Hydrogenimonas thermophila]WOE70006.1 efflux RND transporter periplasmic adaptor subunit [Hydrogenimonas thermophila]WOE72523.1 efflux RND transporter periplasmic adaptor subunit [Hydrogenimonas thermophila]SFP91943.1 RND family efflux transporter, MFP subunit [Hydrogenimonas thermophila]